MYNVTVVQCRSMSASNGVQCRSMSVSNWEQRLNTILYIVVQCRSEGLMRRRIGQKSKQKLNKMLMNLGNGFKKVIKSQRVNGRLPLVDSGSQERSGQMFTIKIISKIFHFF